jgi:3-oxoacyl-(acyl-carrier-protein) synthase
MDVSKESAAVAIVGVAFEFPGCDDWPALTALLREGRDVMRRVPARRAAAMGFVGSATDPYGGWIEDVAGFDYRYFGLSRAEAELMDPRQRRMLQLARLAIGDAGYAPGELAGADVAVLVADPGAPRATLLDLLPSASQRDPFAAMGSVYAYAAGRIAYHFDLRGVAEVIDTSCASFLVALHEARWKLVRGECDVVLVGGYELALGQESQLCIDLDTLGVLSTTGRCRPFDAAADGFTQGEGGGFVVAKRLDAAIRDGDHVHAVVRGSAVNQDARRSAGLTAPSPDAQTEVITAAWRDAGVAPEAIGYIEAHGTGTQIGDPIEIQGLAGALAALTDPPPAAAWLSSAKGNLGHLEGMAAFAGLVRVLAQFRAGEIFPTAGFERPNPLLALDRAPVRIADRVEPWPVNGHRRNAAISSFGLSGTNAHMVIEEGPEPARRAHDHDTDRVIVLSARDAAGLIRQARQLHDLVARDPDMFDLAAASEVLTVGREHFGLRLAWVVRHPKELLERLEAAQASTAAPEDTAQPALPVAVAVGDIADMSLPRLRQYAAAYRGFARARAEAERCLPDTRWSPIQRVLVWLVGGLNVLADAGVEAELLLTHGIGAIAARVAQGEAKLASTLDAAARTAGPTDPPDAARLPTTLAATHTIVDLAPGSALSIMLGQPTPLAEALCALYRQGRDLNWPAVIARRHRRIELPVAPLAEEHCWPAVGTPRSVGDTTAERAVVPTPPAPLDGPPAEVVLQMARDVLGEQNLQPADNFLDAGGNSLSGTQLVTRINERFGTDVGVLELFELPDLGALGETVAYVVAQQPGGSTSEVPASTQQPGGLVGPAVGEGALSGEQLAIWADEPLAQQSGVHNMPVALLLGGDVDPVAVTGWLTDLVHRHPLLRARIQDTPAGPRQVIASAERVTVRLESVEFDFSGWTEREGRYELLDWLEALATEPLSPYGNPPTRYQLVTVRFADGVRQVLLITLHSLFADAWSGHLIWEQLRSGDEDVPVFQRDWFDHVRDQQQRPAETAARLTSFWTGYLAGSRYWPLATDQSGNADPTVAGLRFTLDAERNARLEALAHRQRSTLHMVLLAAWAVLVGRAGGGQEVSVAVNAAGRIPLERDVIASYAKPLITRVAVRPEESFAELLAVVREATLVTFAHQDLPADQLRQIAGRATGPLCSTLFSSHSGQSDPARQLADGSSIELLGVEQAASAVPITVTIMRYRQELQVHLRFADGMFNGDTRERWRRDYQQILFRLAGNDTAIPQRTVRDLLDGLD